MNKLYLITGPAGVGKSTISKIIANNLKKSALIEGDDLYYMIKGGYISPWLEGNHLDVMWKNAISVIHNFLKDGYDVVFNYIINKEEFEILKKEFKNYELKFIVLIVDEETIMKRDKERPEDCQMKERSLILLNNFKNGGYDMNYVLDTSKLTIEETVKAIENEDRFLVKEGNK